MNHSSVQELSTVVDRIISQLLDVRTCEASTNTHMNLAEQDMATLIKAAADLLLAQPTLLKLNAPIKICGCIYGDYASLIRWFEIGGWPPHSKYLFLGNYVDIGLRGIETVCLLLALKLKYPEHIYMIRGNHDCAPMTRLYGFYAECRHRANVGLWQVFSDCFDCLPLAAIINEKIFCVHCGLSPELKHVDQLTRMERPIGSLNIRLISGLLGRKPDTTSSGWVVVQSGLNTCGADVITQFMKDHNFSVICTGNQAVERGYGYEFLANQTQVLVSVFSRPKFKSTDNIGAMMSVDEHLVCSFQSVVQTHQAIWTPQTHKSSPSWIKEAIFCVLLIAKQQAWPFDQTIMYKILSHAAFGWYKQSLDPHPCFSVT